jgi:RES domain-containing protein
MNTITRGGTHYRVIGPDWTVTLDTSYSKFYGGRWNPQSAFGALYLNATIAVAAANARHQHAGRAIQLFDLRPDARPHLVDIDVTSVDVLDVVTNGGLSAIGFPINYPYGVPRNRCQPIGASAYAARIAGVACRSTAECTPTTWVGEELALFDTFVDGGSGASAPPGGVVVTILGTPRAFDKWYPDPFPP